jgi:hypothetical protein
VKRSGTGITALIATGLALLLPLAVFTEGSVRSTWLTLEGAYSPANNYGYGIGDGDFAPISYDPVENTVFSSLPDGGRDLGSPWGSAKIQALLSHRVAVPFLTGEGPLTSGNNIAFTVTGALSPVSTRLEAQTTLTPIAFLNVYVGAMIGTGWDIGVFNGMGLNADGSGVPESASFQGLVTNLWVGGTVQFDLAALLPGEWTHVVTVARPKLQYACFSAADKGEAWMWEADGGENFNGFQYYGTYFLGYQMPLVLDTVGLLVETRQHLGYVTDISPMDSGGWGSDHVEITLSPLFNFSFTGYGALTVLFQFRRERLYDEPSIFANYFRNRSAIGTYWDFYRIAVSYTRPLFPGGRNPGR